MVHIYEVARKPFQNHPTASRRTRVCLCLWSTSTKLGRTCNCCARVERWRRTREGERCQPPPPPTIFTSQPRARARGPHSAFGILKAGQENLNVKIEVKFADLRRVMAGPQRQVNVAKKRSRYRWTREHEKAPQTNLLTKEK